MFYLKRTGKHEINNITCRWIIFDGLFSHLIGCFCSFWPHALIKIVSVFLQSRGGKKGTNGEKGMETEICKILFKPFSN